MQSRRLTEFDIEAAVDFGRTFYSRGAVFKVIGKNEVARYGEEVDLEHLVGVHVVLSHDGKVITAYRNRRFRSADFRKPRRRTRQHWELPRDWMERQVALAQPIKVGI
jgi:hypothetical protein